MSNLYSPFKEREVLISYVRSFKGIPIPARRSEKNPTGHPGNKVGVIVCIRKGLELHFGWTKCMVRPGKGEKYADVKSPDVFRKDHGIGKAIHKIVCGKYNVAIQPFLITITYLNNGELLDKTVSVPVAIYDSADNFPHDVKKELFTKALPRAYKYFFKGE